MRLNGRYETTKRLRTRSGRVEFLAADLIEENRPVVVVLFEGDSALETASESYFLLRGLFCPSIVRPYALQRAWGSLETAGAFLARPFLPGQPVGEMRVRLPAQIESDLCETHLYIERQGISLEGYDPIGTVLAGDGEISLLDLPSADAENLEPWPPMKGDRQTGTPLLRRPSPLPLALYGLETLPRSIVDFASDTLPSGAIPMVTLRGGAPAPAGMLIQETLSAAEARGMRTVEIHAPSGMDILTALSERLSQATGDAGRLDPARSLALLVSESPLMLSLRIRRSRMDEASRLLDRLVSFGGRIAMLVRIDPGPEPALPGNPCAQKHIDLDGYPPPGQHEILRTLLGAETIPSGLQAAIERHEAGGPAEILSLLRLFATRHVLTRPGGEWVFSLSRERVIGLSKKGSAPLGAVMRLGDLERRITALLISLDATIGVAALSAALQEEQVAVHSSLDRLEAAGLVAKTWEYGHLGWRAQGEIPEELVTRYDEIAGWINQFVGYALGSPGAMLSELLAAMRFCREEPNALSNIAYAALLLAKEQGELDLITALASELAHLPEEALSEPQVRNIIETVEPCRLQRIDTATLKPFLEKWAGRFGDPHDRALAIARLGEVEYLEHRPETAERLFSDAVELCCSGGGCDKAAEILSAAARAVTSKASLESLAARVRKLIMDRQAPEKPENAVSLLSWAAVLLADSGSATEALELIQSASAILPQAGPAGQQTYNWCRGRAHMAAGELVPAASHLERALLLAENRGDLLAVAEILGSLVLCQERLPGYTIRQMMESLDRVAARAASTGNVSYRASTVSRLVVLCIRSLQLDRATRLLGEYEQLGRGPDSPEAPHLAWYECLLHHFCGIESHSEGAEAFLPGTSELLDSLRTGMESAEDAERVAGAFRHYQNGDLIPAGIYLALECAACGFPRSARIIGRALADAYRPRLEEVLQSWRLCINGILAPRVSEAEKVFWSAQQISRQLDRLLLVWLVLRVRQRLDPGSGPGRDASVAVLLEELDRHILSGLPPHMAASFESSMQLRERRERLAAFCDDPAAPLVQLRDSAADRAFSGGGFEGLEAVRADYGMRSDLSWGLEVLDTFASASRVMILSLEGEKHSVLERSVSSKDLPPSPEVVQAARRCEGRHLVVDNFGKTPFGNRFLHAVPLGRRSHGPQPAERRRRVLEGSRDGNYLVVEADLPFDTLSKGRASILMCLARQIGAALALRDLEQQTWHDGLTGAKISAVWVARLKEDLSSGRVTKERPLAVLMMDLDFFKSVNDTFGHREGDRVLKAFVETVSSTIRPDDMIARLGGEEFGVLLDGTSEAAALGVAERIRRKVATSVLRPDRHPVTVSIGIAVAPLHGDVAELVIRRSDIALYHSKDKGRNRCTMWDSTMASTFTERSPVTLLDTGDPGWDQHISRAVLRMVSSGEATLHSVADETRNALRCEYLRLESASGEKVVFGPEEIHRSIRLQEPGQPGKPVEFMSQDWKYFCLSCTLPGGGALVAAWKASEALPKSLPMIMKSFAGLAAAVLGKPGQG